VGAGAGACIDRPTGRLAHSGVGAISDTARHRPRRLTAAAQVYLEGTYSEIYTEKSDDEEGLAGHRINPNFGRISAQRSNPRNMQMMLRYQF
jgi:hypothetical protein